LAIDVGNRTLARAQRVVHHVVQVLAPDCAPLFLTDGFREYRTALRTHYGQWVHGSVTDSCAMAPWRTGVHASQARVRKALAGTHYTNYVDMQQVVQQSYPGRMITLDSLGPSCIRMIRISTVICYASRRVRPCATSARRVAAVAAVERRHTI